MASLPGERLGDKRHQGGEEEVAQLEMEPTSHTPAAYMLNGKGQAVKGFHRMFGRYCAPFTDHHTGHGDMIGYHE